MHKLLQTEPIERKPRQGYHLRLNRFLPRTRVEGPGERACLWVQGCPIRCAGCAVPDTWPARGGENISTAALLARILNEPGLEGVTFLGGEPFAQAAALAHLGAGVQKAGLGVLTFSGYTEAELFASHRADWRALLSVTDLLIAGRFEQNQLDLSRPWTGSANQTWRFLTPRYEHLQKPAAGPANRVEVRVGPGGEVALNGLAGPVDWLGLQKALARDGC